METIESFDDDKFDLFKFGERLEKFIKIEQRFVENSLVIGLTAKYGSGKSTFLRMWSESIKQRDNTDDTPLIVILNAWESDYFGDPLFAIASSMINSLRNQGESVNALVEAMKDVGWFTLSLGSQVSNKLTGIDPIVAGKLAEDKKAKRNLFKDAFSVYEDRKGSMQVLKEEIKLFVEKTGTSILFLVDELDRCRPDYAIAYLETIKHIFDINGVNFVLAADRNQLENSAKQAFGANLDFDEYYRKFVHREVTLPKISKEGYKKLADKYVECYLKSDTTRFCYLNLDSSNINNIRQLLQGLNLTPRQTQEVFRIAGHVLETTEDKSGRIYWCLGICSIAMAAFKVSNRQIYNQLGHKELEPIDALNFLNARIDENHVDWWFMLLLTGDGIKTSENEGLFDVMKLVGLLNDDDEENFKVEVRQLSHGWGHRDSRLITIYQNIEEILQWV